MQGGRFFLSGRAGEVAYHFIGAILPGASANSYEKKIKKKGTFSPLLRGPPFLSFPEIYSKADSHNQLSVDFRSEKNPREK